MLAVVLVAVVAATALADITGNIRARDCGKPAFDAFPRHGSLLSLLIYLFRATNGFFAAPAK